METAGKTFGLGKVPTLGGSAKRLQFAAVQALGLTGLMQRDAL